MSVGSSALRALYMKVVSYEATWKSGGDAINKNELTPPQEGVNNFGNAVWKPLKDRSGLEEGALFSRVMNRVPGMNAPGMLPAAALAYGALVSDYTHMIDQSERYRRRR